MQKIDNRFVEKRWRFLALIVNTILFILKYFLASKPESKSFVFKFNMLSFRLMLPKINIKLMALVKFILLSDINW